MRFLVRLEEEGGARAALLRRRIVGWVGEGEPHTRPRSRREHTEREFLRRRILKEAAGEGGELGKETRRNETWRGVGWRKGWVRTFPSSLAGASIMTVPREIARRRACEREREREGMCHLLHPRLQTLTLPAPSAPQPPSEWAV